MSLLCLVIVGKDNEPLYQRDFSPSDAHTSASSSSMSDGDDDPFGFHEAMQSSEGTISLRHEVRSQCIGEMAACAFCTDPLTYTNRSHSLCRAVHDARVARSSGRSLDIRASMEKSVGFPEMDWKIVPHGRNAIVWCVQSQSCWIVHCFG